MQHLNLEVRKTINPTFRWVEWGLPESPGLGAISQASWLNRRLRDSFNGGDDRAEIFGLFMSMDIEFDIQHFLDVLDELFPEE